MDIVVDVQPLADGRFVQLCLRCIIMFFTRLIGDESLLFQAPVDLCEPRVIFISIVLDQFNRHVLARKNNISHSRPNTI